MKNNFYKKKNKKYGFTLVETLVAIFIVMLAITGPMVFTQNALRAAFLSRDQITAFFLAQDAIEYIKNIRDGNVVEIVKSSSLPPGGWLGSGNLKSLCMNNAGCTIDTTDPDESSAIKTCLSESEPGCVNDSIPTQYKPLNLTENETFTNKPIGSTDVSKPSLFAREIKMENIVSDQEAQITVTVRWKSHESVGVREIVVRENIYNWAYALLSR